MSEWGYFLEEFPVGWQAVSPEQGRTGTAVAERPARPERPAAPAGDDPVTRYLSSVLRDAVRVDATVLGIELASVTAESRVVPLSERGGSGGCWAPLVRYTVKVVTSASDDALMQLHERVRTMCVPRLEYEFSLQLEGVLTAVEPAAATR